VARADSVGSEDVAVASRGFHQEGRLGSSLSRESTLGGGSVASVGGPKPAQGLTESAAFFVNNSLTPNTVKRREREWRIWADWAEANSVVAENPSSVDLVNFISEMARRGMSTSVIKNLKSMISTSVELNSGVALGKTKLVKSALRGLTRSRPLQLPKYDEFWDVDVLVDYVRKMSTELRKDKRAKAIVLLKLASITRADDLSKIVESTMVFSEESLSFLMKGIKSDSINFSERVTIHRFKDDIRVCPVLAMEEYLRDLRTVCSEVAEIGVFRGIVRPFKVLSAVTIAKQTLEVMKAAGIDVNKFGAHSTRGAAASKALNKGSSVEQVMAAGRWSSWEVFNRFYNRANKGDIASSILSPSNK